MKTSITIEYGEGLIFKVEPSGFKHIQIELREPSQAVEVIIPVKDAHALGERLIRLSEVLEQERS